MPLTPYHLGPALFFGLLFFSFIHLPTFLIANVIIDLEPFLVLLFGLDYPLHGFFHLFFGGSIVAIILSMLMVRFDKHTRRIMSFFRLEQRYSEKSIWLASFSGIYLHIMLDSPLYVDIKPIFPFMSNPFYGMFSAFEIYNFCLLSFLFGICIYIYKLWKQK
ncbi:MAG: hypothetical protein ABIG39_01510 [Candidatus Micrarchaeota archaeon]